MTRTNCELCAVCAAVVLLTVSVCAQGPAPNPPNATGPDPEANEFVIGPEDVLAVFFWREKEMTGDVTVRPDGVVTIPLIGDVRAAGLSPVELAGQLEKVAGRYLTDPKVTVTVRQSNSRTVYLTGEVRNPGSYPLGGGLTVMQAISLAGGVTEFADASEITVLRADRGQTRPLKFNYDQVARGQKLEQNVPLWAGDTIVVP
jgi:polysaccharide export outer membrane protein